MVTDAKVRSRTTCSTSFCSALRDLMAAMS